MKSEVLALVEELKRLRRSGVERVFVSEGSLQSLRSTASAMAAPKASDVSAALESIPEHVRSASAAEFDQLVTEKRPRAAAAAPTSASANLKPPAIELPSGSKQRRWEAAREAALACKVAAQRMAPGARPVFGSGNLDATILVCGECPSAEDEAEGHAFAGEAGELLGKMLKAAGIRREDTYLCHALHWRSPGAREDKPRPPKADEIDYCIPFLRAQVEIVAPKLIVALGVVASKALLGRDSFRNLRDVKGRWGEFGGVPVMPTFHPNYLLHNESKRDKRAAWEDWLQVMEKAGLSISDKQRGYFL